MSSAVVKVVKVILALSKLSASKLVEAVESILSKMSGNTNFPIPNPALTEVGKAKDQLVNAVAKAKKGSVADKALVPEFRLALMLLLYPLRSYVEDISNSDPSTALSVALSSGMGVRKTTTPPKRTFRVKNLLLEGSVKLSCPKLKGQLLFNYKYSNTPDVLTSFVEIGALPRVTRTVADLTPAKTYTFMYCAISKFGTTDWSDPITILVM